MCCLSKNRLKLLSFISCLIALGIGSVLIWGGSQLISFALQTTGSIFTGYIIIGIGSLLNFFSILGLIGIFKENKVLLTLFIITSLVIGFLLITVSALLIYARSILMSSLDSQSSCLSNFKTADDSSIKAGQVICHIYCPCRASNEYMDSLRARYSGSGVAQQIFAYSDAGTSNILSCDPCYEIKKYGKNSTGAIDQAAYNELTTWISQNLNLKVNTTHCDSSKIATVYQTQYFDSSIIDYYPLLTWVEQKFQCSGLCTAQEVFMFSDTNNGRPTGSCQKDLDDWISVSFLAAGISGIVVGVYFIVNVIVTGTLCCRKNKITSQVMETEVEYMK